MNERRAIIDWHLEHEVFAVGHGGRVWRLKKAWRNRFGEGFIESVPTLADIQPSSNGYRRVAMDRAGTKITVMAHILVFEILAGPIPPDHVIHHKNGDRADNRLTNLRLVSWDLNQDMANWIMLWPPDTTPDDMENDVFWIKAAASAGQSTHNIARRFNLSPGVVNEILTGAICPHITL
jgi:hypothetical protein